MMLVMLLLVPVSCTSTSSEPEDEEELTTTEEQGEEQVVESWEIGEHWQYSQQALWGDNFVGIEYIFGDGLEAQYISIHNLRTGEKERVLELDPGSVRAGPPSIYENRIVWPATDISGKQLSEIDWDELDWNIFLLDLETREVQQITTDEHAQTEPKVYGDTIVWLDSRHVEGYHNPEVFDVYTYDIRRGQERRLTSFTSAEEHSLSISDNMVVWSDNRHADPEVTIHAGNEPDYNNEIYIYNLTTNKERRVTTYPGNDHYPAIDGNRVVWLRQSDYLQADIFVFDLESGQEAQVSSSGYAVYNPAIHGDRVVWADARVSKGNTSGDVIMNGQSGSADIYLYDLGTKQETRLVPSQTEGESSGVVFRQVWMNPVIQGEYVVYTLERQIGSIVYAMRLTKK